MRTNAQSPPEYLPIGSIEPLASSRTRSLLIQSGDPRIRSSDKSLSNREFATSAVGKNDAIVGGCRGQRGQKRCQCHLRNRQPSRLCRSRKFWFGRKGSKRRQK